MDSSLDTVNILNIPVFNGDEKEVIQYLIKTAHLRDSRCISASGAHGLVCSKENPFFKHILNNFFLNLPDGTPLVWMGKLKGAKKIKRCYGPDVFKNLMIQSATFPIRHFLCGGKPGIAHQLEKECNIKFNNPHICGTYSPPFQELNENQIHEIAKMIASHHPDIVWIGLGTPKQEIFAYRISKYLQCGYIITVGAAFDFHTGAIQQAPKFLQKIGLEWFFRLMMEPKRLWKRYLNIVPKFLTYSFIDLIISNRTRRK